MQLLHHLLEDYLDVVEVDHLLRDIVSLVIRFSTSRNVVPFPLVDRQGNRWEWRSWWSELFLLFCRNGSHRIGGHFFVVNGFLILFRKLIDVFVLSPADHNLRLRSITLHGINFDFNSIKLQVIRNLDFQYWQLLLFPRIHSFGLDLSSSRREVYPRQKPAHPISKRNLSYKTSVTAGFTHSNVFWKVVKSFFVLLPPRFPELEHCSKVTLSRLTHWRVRLQIPIHLSPWPQDSLYQMKSAAPVRYCSVDTELIDGNNYTKQQLCCRWITVVVYRTVSSSCFSKSLEESTCSSEHQMSALSKINHHHQQFSHIIPQNVWFVTVLSVPLFFSSWSEEWPMSFKKSSGVRRNIWRNRPPKFSVSFFSPVNVFVHRYEDGSIFESFRLKFIFSCRSLNFLKLLQCCVPWANFPLEHDWLSVNTFHFTIIWRLRKPLNFCLSNTLLIVDTSNFAKTKHRIGENEYRCCWQFDSSVVQRSTFSRMGLYSRQLIHFCEISNHCLIFSKSVFLVVRKLSKMYRRLHLSLTWIFTRSSRWRRSLACHLPVDDQVFLSYVRVDYLKMANIVPGYPQVVVR